MPRVARFVLPGLPYHVTHRGNRRQPVFVEDQDRHVYLLLLRRYAAEADLAVWGYCLMPNHMHLLVVPGNPESLARGIGLAHRRFAQRQNSTHGWTGHLFEGRYYSAGLDERHLWACVRYIERNPVRAGLAESAAAWPWSSAGAHCLGKEDPVLHPSRPFPHRLGRDWVGWLAIPAPTEEEDELRRATRTGRPCGAPGWVRGIEAQTGRRLVAMPRGRPRKEGAATPPASATLPDLFDGT